MLNETLAEKKFLFVFFQRVLNNDVTILKTRLSPYKILGCIFMVFDASCVCLRMCVCDMIVERSA